MLSPLLIANSTLGPYYTAGASVSMLASAFVIFSYAKFKELRKHPSALIFWRSIFDVFFSLQFIILYVWEDARDHCDFFSFAFQFTVLGSQSWYFMIALDLYRALQNPFTNTKKHVIQYHVFVWTTSLLTGLVIPLSDSAAFRSGVEVCWIEPTRDASSVNPLNWVLFFVPIIMYYSISVFIMIYAACRLNQGLDETFKIRSQTLRNGARYVLAFCVYWTIAGVIYGNVYALETDNENDPNFKPEDHLEVYGSFAVVLGIRGLIDVIVWTYNQQVVAAYRRWMAGAPARDEAFTDINRALRKEVLLYSTQGICDAIDKATDAPLLKNPSIHNMPRSIHVSEDNTNVKVTTLLRNDTEQKKPVPFFDFAPEVFRHLRHSFNISDEDYKASIRGDTNAMIEKFTEGASGSFFYFSEDTRYIVKTLSKSEAQFFIEFLPKYVTYMTQNKDSLIVKFLGMHAIKLYNLTLYFVVMQSVFLTNARIHQRYDIKGSWVDRHAAPSKGKKTVGVLKDSDLNSPLSLTSRDKELFLEQVTNDSRFLAASGIMDYSLLIGVHNLRQKTAKGWAEKEQKGEDDDVRQPQSRAPFFQADDGGMQARVVEGPGLYFFGIIDILQTWSTKKKLERFFKVWMLFKDGDGISATSPHKYSQRFVRAMHNITEDDSDDAEDKGTFRGSMSARGGSQRRISTGESNGGSTSSFAALLASNRDVPLDVRQ